jgi:hypothetical protein
MAKSTAVADSGMVDGVVLAVSNDGVLLPSSMLRASTA